MVQVTISVSGNTTRRTTLPELPRRGDRMLMRTGSKVYEVVNVMWFEEAEDQWEIRVVLR